MLRIGIDARLVDATNGGITQAIIGLAHGLSALNDGNEEYLFLTYPDADDWLRPYLAGPCRTLPSMSPPHRKAAWKQTLVRLSPVVQQVWDKFSPVAGQLTISLPQSDGTIERAGIDMFHFTIQNAFLTHIPSIFEPYDLQHLHLPEMHNPRTRLYRETSYRAFCEQAKMVATMTSWVKRDLIEQYKLAEDKVKVVQRASPLAAYPIPQDRDLQTAQQKFRLPENFILYPAITWPHKNHIGLLQSLALLRDRGIVVPLIASGYQNDFYPFIQEWTQRLKLENQVQFLGFVSPLELQSLYRLCRALIFPSRFEGWGLPVTEAFSVGIPVACSNVTSLPDVAGDAALLFDPNQPEQIADAIRRLWTDEALRRELIERGEKRSELFSWDRTARLFRAHYRRIAERKLTEEDHILLSEPLIV